MGSAASATKSNKTKQSKHRKSSTSLPSKSDYNILGAVGQGGHGVVYCAKNVHAGNVVALKLVRCEGMQDVNTALEENFFIHSDKELYLVEDFCEYGDLYSVLNNLDRYETLDLPSIRTILFQTLEALRYLHSKRIIHRDVKPGNRDFGLSRRLETSHASSLLGTLYYIPPEMVSRRSYNDKFDIWSLGVMALEMCLPRSLLSKQGFICTLATKEPHQFARILDMVFYQGFDEASARYFRELLTLVSLPPLPFDLVKMLAVDPEARSSAADLLKHSFFDDVRSVGDDAVDILACPSTLPINDASETVQFNGHPATFATQATEPPRANSADAMGAYGLTEKAASFDSPFGGHSIFSKEFDLSADEDGHIVEWKPRAQRLFGYSTDDVKQLRLHDLITPSPDAVIDELHRMLLTESLKLGAEAQRGARFCQVLSFVVQRGLREAAWEITRKGRKRTTVFVRLEVRVLADRLHFFLFVGEPAGSHRDLPTEEMADVGAGPT